MYSSTRIQYRHNARLMSKRKRHDNPEHH
jgi:hypothetical protein